MIFATVRTGMFSNTQPVMKDSLHVHNYSKGNENIVNQNVIHTTATVLNVSKPAEFILYRNDSEHLAESTKIPTVATPNGTESIYSLGVQKVTLAVEKQRGKFEKETETIKQEGEKINTKLEQTDALNSTTIFSPGKYITTHIAFLKVHKAGSTTMQNMFFRFGMKHNLNILLPTKGNYFGAKKHQMPIRPLNHYDIFAIHTVYSKILFDSLLPVDSVKIGIVREPVDRMMSAAYYYRDVMRKKYLRKVPRENFITNLIRYPELYEHETFSNTRNTMAWDFGFSKDIRQSDVEKIQLYLNQLNSEFSLVLVVEKMEESLVLMRRLLRWSISDIIYLKINKHTHQPAVLTEEDKAKFRNTSFLDFEIYRYFRKVLDEKLEQEENDFWDEVNYFKTLLNRVSEFCLKGNDVKSLFVEKSAWNEDFSVTRSDCQWMTIPEMAFIKSLRERHKQMHQLTK